MLALHTYWCRRTSHAVDKHDRLVLFNTTRPLVATGGRVFVVSHTVDNGTDAHGVNHGGHVGTFIRRCKVSERKHPDRCWIEKVKSKKHQQHTHDHRARGGTRGMYLTHGYSREETQRAREQANFSLVLRGDTLGSDRWQNSMAAGAILVAVVNDDSDLKWLPFQHRVPWKEFVVRIRRTRWVQGPVAALDEALHELRADPAKMRALQQQMLCHVPDVDWSAYHSRVAANMLENAASCKCTYHT